MFRFFIPLILFSFSIMLYTGYTKPNMDVVESVRRDVLFASSTLSVKKDEIEKKRTELESARSLIGIKEEEKLKNLMPAADEFDEAAFINNMNGVANRHSMVLRGVSVSGISKKIEDGTEKKDNLNSGKYTVVSISFSVSGTYTEIKNFLKDLEKNDQLLDITSISFSEARDDEESNYQITIDTYYWTP